MSYRIYSDDSLVYSRELAQYGITSGTLELELNSCGSFNFVLPDGHPMNGHIQKLKSTIKVTDDDVIVFVGRVLNMSTDFYNSVTYECEGCLAWLNDSIIEPYDYTTEGNATSIQALLTKFLHDHNQQVTDGRKLRIGAVSFPEGEIARANSQYESTWTNLRTKLIDLSGGFILPRYEASGIYLDYMQTIESTNGQRIELGVNLLDLQKESDGADIATILIPLGADDENGQPITIATVNDGLKYIEDLDGIARFGRITKTMRWEDVTVPSNLLTKAEEYLQQVAVDSTTVEVSALDLSVVGDASAIRCGRNVVVNDPAHGVNATLLVNRRTYDLLNPGNDTFTLSRTFSRMSDIINDNKLAQDIKIQTTADSVSEAIVKSEEAYTKVTQTKEYVDTVVVGLNQRGAHFVESADGFDIYAIVETDDQGYPIAFGDSYTHIDETGMSVITASGAIMKATAEGFQHGEWIMQQSQAKTLDLYRKG